MDKKSLASLIPSPIKPIIYNLYHEKMLNNLFSIDQKKFKKYSFGLTNNVNTFEQLDAQITKAYHSIEKGLSYQKLRLGFGEKALYELIELMLIFKTKGYPLNSHCYETALSNLNEYIKVHESNNFDVSILKERIQDLGNNGNNDGGARVVYKEEILESLNKDFKCFSSSRHSVRDYSEQPVEVDVIKKALQLAQNTPSACNRQSQRIRIVGNRELKELIRENQNGNRGFGEKIDKFLIITSDSQYFAKPRERNQAYVDGGMYAMNLLYSLHFYGIATIPLSAALINKQEETLRESLGIKESEVFIMFIGLGNYIDNFKVPKSTRKDPVFYEFL